MARGGCVCFRVTSCSRSVASSSPSMSTRSGRVRSRNARNCQAPIGDRWRMPKTLICQVMDLLVVLGAGLEQRSPIRAALLDHVGQVLLPGGPVLLLVLDNGTLQPGGEIVRRHLAGTEVAGERHAV